MKTKIIEKIFQRKIFTTLNLKKETNNKAVNQDVDTNSKVDSKYLEIFKRLMDKNLQNVKKKT